MRRPRVKQALLRLACDSRTLQFGIDPRRSLVLTDLEPAVQTLIAELDGRHDAEGVLRRGVELGLDAQAVRRLLDLLDEHHVLEDAAESPDVLRPLTPGERQRLQSRLDAIALRPGVRDGGLGVLSRRRNARVRVYGASRVGTTVAALLGASGVGHIRVADPARVNPADLSPGGLNWADEGERREDAAAAAVGRVAPSASVLAGSPFTVDDASLVVLCPAGPLEPAVVHHLMSGGVPHLVATASEGIGSVGPLVIPGRTACLGCLDLDRRDRDPGWPGVLAGLGGHPYGEHAAEDVLAAMAAAQAAGQALAYIDDLPLGVINATIEAVMPDWQWRRRTWAINPECRCSGNDLRSLTMIA